MYYIKAPHKNVTCSIFLAGGISNCSDWQDEVAEYFEDSDLTIINPRRDDFDINDAKMAEQQIEWEFCWINRADVILFWFPCETLCPITLFELGCALTNNNKDVWVGTHPDYARRFDVKKQVELRRPSIFVYDELISLLSGIWRKYDSFC